MVSSKAAVWLAFVLINIVLLYYILTTVYVHLVLLLLTYLGYKYYERIVQEHVSIRGKGVLITGCDTGIFVFLQNVLKNVSL